MPPSLSKGEPSRKRGEPPAPGAGAPPGMREEERGCRGEDCIEEEGEESER